MNLFWYAIQIAIIGGVFAINQSEPEPSPPAAVLIVGVALAVAITFVSVKAIDLARLLGRWLRDHVRNARRRAD